MNTAQIVASIRRNKPEIYFFVVCWLVVFSLPVFSEAYSYAEGDTSGFDWLRLRFVYLSTLPLFVCFLIGKLVIEPLYYKPGSLRKLFVSIALTALLVSAVFCSLIPHRPHHRRADTMVQTERIESRHDTRDSHPARPPMRRGPWPLHGPFMPTAVMSMLLMGASLSVSMAFRYRRDQLELQEQQAALLQSELDYLKYQINPHFFMNTLNNIHALVDIDSELAKGAIIELSRMMRYLLYESNQPTVPLSKELSFVQHYLELMRLRCDDTVSISFHAPAIGDTADMQSVIPPMLLISFIENAFKHGISHKEPSFIDIDIQLQGGQFRFCCRNSNFGNESHKLQQGGVGLDNVRKRLQLIYPGKHSLTIVPSEKEFLVELSLPMGMNENIVS